MDAEKPKGCTVGLINCPTCGKEVRLKANKKGHLYVYCDQPADGGCGAGTTSRSDRGDELLAARCKKFVRPEYRAIYAGDSVETLDDGEEAEKVEEAEAGEDEDIEDAEAEDAEVEEAALTPHRVVAKSKGRTKPKPARKAADDDEYTMFG